jgi:hypothetical protein
MDKNYLVGPRPTSTLEGDLDSLSVGKGKLLFMAVTLSSHDPGYSTVEVQRADNRTRRSYLH